MVTIQNPSKYTAAVYGIGPQIGSIDANPKFARYIVAGVLFKATK